MTKGNPVGDALASLSKLLQDREEELEAREEKLLSEQKNFERERFAVYGDTRPSDVLHLNVGGTRTAVLRRTLTSVPGSMLASRFSGRWDDSIEKDKDGNFFIDQPFSLFEPMLDYLRNRSNGTELYSLVSNNLQYTDFHRMVEYYGMTHGIFPTHLTLDFGSREAVEMISPLKVNANEWVTFEVSLGGHSRCIKSYELTLGSVQRIQIGWKYGGSEVKFSGGNSLGVGDVANTSAIDLSRSCYLIDGTSTSIHGLEHKEGTIVRSEDYGKNWYVDGKLVATASETREDGVVQSFEPKRWSNVQNACSHMHPVISIKGEFEITSVEFKI